MGDLNFRERSQDASLGAACARCIGTRYGTHLRGFGQFLATVSKSYDLQLYALPGSV